MRKVIGLALLGALILGFSGCESSEDKAARDKINQTFGTTMNAKEYRQYKDDTNKIIANEEKLQAERKLERAEAATNAEFRNEFQMLLMASCNHYRAQLGFGTISDMIDINGVDNMNADMSKGGIINLKAGKDICITYTYTKDGTITVEAAKNAKGKICLDFIQSEKFKNMEHTYDCKSSK